jgi:hypothetical protein
MVRGNRLTAVTLWAAASVTVRVTRIIIGNGGEGRVTVGPVASTLATYPKRSWLLKSHEYVNAPVQFPQPATAVNVMGEPGTSGLGEKLQEAL